ncbi:hypothetical protein [Aurantibacillus circumpalustris]|uniref:hypothetical protein n=1 Tax=Aurantibacillus circumpalustris TaxID=3036359 RepID=UPI00295AE653|nr:hypothetical protein [Aurantibacillus circumpalustris]
MKTTIKLFSITMTVLLLIAASCKKDKKDPIKEPEPTPDPQEVITTFKLILTDSASNISSVYMFKDPDGDGGQAGFYGPTSTSQTDSVITLAANKTYYGKIVLLDETKSPVDSISNEVKSEGVEHMFFYNNGNNTILNSVNPYTVKLNGSDIKITYLDLDAGTPQRGIGLQTLWRTTMASGTTKHLLNITLKHQPDSKDGTYGPGESDVSVDFKVMLN